jgi:phosphatidylserine/phosphatidylglycerophosphate/cardiolipin synthase-like enzyme
MYRRFLWLCLLALAVSACDTMHAPKLSPQTPTNPTTALSTSTSTQETTTIVAPATRATKAPSGSLSVLVEPAAGYGFVTSAINNAARSVTLTLYELEDPAVLSALEQAQHRGVAVSIVLDAHLERSANTPAYDELAAAGVSVHWGAADTTFHQKTLCIDGRTCYVMTGNLTPQYYDSDRDFVVVDSESADVAAIGQVFATDASGRVPDEISPTGADLLWSPGSEGALFSLIASARSSLLVENEEMDAPAITSALEVAAGRGVSVTVIMTTESEWSSAFSDLESAGVHVRTYGADAALYVHAKAIVADGNRAFVGSENFSDASLDYNRELGIITSDASIVPVLGNTLSADGAGAAPWSG